MSKARWNRLLYMVLPVLAAGVLGYEYLPENIGNTPNWGYESTWESDHVIDLTEIPEYGGEPYVVINDNMPYFDESEMENVEVFEYYSPLDELGRCGYAMACFGRETMPVEERGDISKIKPTGWNQNYYDKEIVETEYLLSRCHLLMRALGGDDIENNLISGTSYMNTKGMLDIEEELLSYVKDTGNHILYRVTPIFEEDNLFAFGVLLECASIEDDEIRTNVFCYNVQPGIEISYETGENWVEGEKILGETTYILNTNSKKFHKISCDSVNRLQSDHKKVFEGTRSELLSMEYSPCGVCKP